jgi:hypothetical protein
LWNEVRLLEADTVYMYVFEISGPIMKLVTMLSAYLAIASGIPLDQDGIRDSPL